MSAPDFGARADAIVEDAYWGSRNQDDTLADILSLISEIREAVAREIEARSEELIAGVATDAWEHGYEVALRDAARIARCSDD